MNNKQVAKLILENGMVFEGYSFGCKRAVSGEIVFNTSMVGYPEMLTDASYYGQILCLTYPLIGNYGMPSDETTKEGLSIHLESNKSQPKGLVVFDYSVEYSNWEAVQCLDSWMKDNGVTGIYGVDTRELMSVLRDCSPMRAVIVPEGCETPSFEATINAVDKVSTKEVVTYKPENPINKKVVLLDCGVRHSIIRDLLNRGIEVIRVPYKYDFTAIEYDGLYVSNGPGNPAELKETVKLIQKAMEAEKPIFGLQLGCQLLGLAAGCKTERLKKAHRASNIPIRKIGTNRAYITSHNSAYTIASDSIPVDWDAIYINLNDNSVAGIKHHTKPFYGTQFNPEVCIGLNENFTLIDEFVSKL